MTEDDSRRTQDEVSFPQQLDQQKKAEKQFNHAMPAHLSKKQTVSSHTNR
jgi:hypothetical protein